MRTLLVNLLVLVVLVALVALLPPLLFDAYRFAGSLRKGGGDSRLTLPNYKDIAWAEQHFREFSGLRSTYHDFIGWRRAPFEGQTIKIDREGYRRHPESPSREAAQVWVFGGSTVWGPGVDDAATIPARVQAHARRSVFNFGEAAYTAHQSYNLLIKNYLLGGRPAYVVFYDGANEVVIKCRTELGFYSTSHEATIRDRTNGASLTPQVFAPTLETIGRTLARIAPSARAGNSGYDCHTNEAKRKQIAAALVMDWMLARQMVEAKGGRFVAVLQPIAFFGTPRLDHLPSVRTDLSLRQQYESMYPEIVQQLRQAGITYTDLTDAFDGDELLYIDFAHVSPRGNEIAGKRIAELLN
jgi:hypothetical protein